MEGRRSSPRHLKGFSQERPLAAVSSSSSSAIIGIVPSRRVGSTAMHPAPEPIGRIGIETGIGTATSATISSSTRPGRPITIGPSWRAAWTDTQFTRRSLLAGRNRSDRTAEDNRSVVDACPRRRCSSRHLISRSVRSICLKWICRLHLPACCP